MAKKDFFVLKDSLTKDGDFLAKGTKVSLDEKETVKLVSLKNIEEYNSEKHDAIADAKLKLEKENASLISKVDELEKENASLKKELMALKKDK